MDNRLKHETSPYLLQHADNPVEWHPWDERALELARATGKPILLSIGYSACHWCHVMAHESFEDDATAELMNRLYVNIKVDREERPDIDKIYQLAHQLFTGRPGGWPLTAFLMPDDHLPILVGTYFPKTSRYGMPAFKEVLSRVETYYREHPDEIRAQGGALVDALGRIDAPPEDGAAVPDAEPLTLARTRLIETFDAKHGGFGGAPKFPRAASLELSLELWRAGGSSDDQLLHIVRHTLTTMARGGIYDQLGGGFYRYSVDAGWSIPHFEKMLYDNAALLGLYADLHAGTGDPLSARVANETADWVMRDMQGADGGYFATLDADSEGEEGKFYLWTPQELDAVLEERESQVAKSVFGLYGEANFEGKHWHLRRAERLATVCETSGLERVEAERLLDSAKRKLLRARDGRAWPGRDEKVLASWNGLMIRAMARAARRLQRPELAASAGRAAELIRTRLWRDGRLNAVYKDGRARFPAYLDDYAFLADGLLELAQCTWRSAHLRFAQALLEVLLARFEDPRGGFFFVADDHERLIHKPKSISDEAVPSGNAVALLLLLKLGHLLGEQRYLASAERGLKTVWPLLQQYPDAHASMLRALRHYLTPPEIIVVRGGDGELEAWRRRLGEEYRPDRLALCIPAGETALPGLLGERKPRGEGLIAYVCEGTQCRAPITDPQELHAALGTR